ncbi:histidine kinase 3-like [Andrographis paniculata]|uniref:histidine kinase 3-like n=1 Tax=Andrographis paniculata TaxID=175694 RepID=UPI0021E6E5D4|nr:histidine kinase 3-like [Andrographis paniculata]
MNLFNIIAFASRSANLILISGCWAIMTVAVDGEKVWRKAAACGGRIQQLQHYSRSRKVSKNWWRKLLVAWLLFGSAAALSVFWYMNSQAAEKRKETLAGMCDERARMLQDQFNVSMNHIQAMSVMVSTFHHSKSPSAVDQRTFAWFTEKTGFERPLTSGVAYAVRVLHADRDEFEVRQGWSIKRMDNVEQTPVHEDEYDPADLEPSPVQEEYAPVVFAQDTVAHIISIDVLSGKEDRDNVLRARESGKGVLTAPFRLLKTNRLGVILTFAVYKRDLSPTATPHERIQETAGYLGGIFDIESLVEKLLQQLASTQTILVNVYDMTNSSHPISMYGSTTSSEGLHHVSPLNFGDPFRKHAMHCRFKQRAPWPWVAITTSVGILIISLLVGQIFHATVNRIAKVEDDYHKMMELKKRSEAADIAKSQFLATVSHEIRTPMNGVLGMLHMLMDTELDETQQDYVRTARSSGKALVSLINEVLDQAKIESGKLELEAVCFDLRAILDDVLTLFSGKSQDKRLELAVYVSSRVPATLVGDPGRFRQIVMNLVGNSIKFTDKGHIFVTVHLVEEVIKLIDEEFDTTNTLSGVRVVNGRESWPSFNRDSAVRSSSSSSSSSSLSSEQINLIVSVEDTGQGIPVEAQSRVFNPFMQVGPSITRTHGGTGIGLSISKCLVRLMNGEIGLASSPQVGSTFTFTAVFANGCSDLNDRISQQVSSQSNSLSSEFQGMEALVIDSNPIRANVSKYHIERLGIHVEVVCDSSRDFSSLNPRNTPINMVFVEEEIWEKDKGIHLRLSATLSTNQTVAPTMLILSKSSNVSPGAGCPNPFVVVKPLRASMLAASLQRAMGVGNRGKVELQTLSLNNLLRGRRILVVDDNPVNLHVADGALKRYGADVILAERGKDAISLLTPFHRFDACFMDIQMPEMDGFEATKRIREIESSINDRLRSGDLSVEDFGSISNWHVTILAMTADVIQATNEECLKCEMDGYVSKPFEADLLYREVSQFFHTATPDEKSQEMPPS